MLNKSSSLCTDVLQIIEDFSGNDVADALLPALAKSLEQIDDLLYYVLSVKDAVLIQSHSDVESKTPSGQGYAFFQDNLTARYGFGTPKPEVEIKAFADLIFMILKLHQRYTQIQERVQQEQNQAFKALKNTAPGAERACRSRKNRCPWRASGGRSP